MKKILSTILSILMIMATVSCAFAAEECEHTTLDNKYKSFCTGCGEYVGMVVEVGGSVTIDYSVNGSRMIKFTAPESAKYLIRSSDDTYRYGVIIHNEDLEVIDGINRSGYGLKYTNRYEKDTTYYIWIHTASSNNKDKITFTFLPECSEHTGGTQNCSGYKCDICNKYYGEAIGEHIDGGVVRDGDKIISVNPPDGLCDNCNAHIGPEVTAGGPAVSTMINIDICFGTAYLKFTPATDGNYLIKFESEGDVGGIVFEIFDENFYSQHQTGLKKIDEYNYVADFRGGEDYYIYAYNFNGEVMYMSIECETHTGTTQTCMGYICDGCGQFFGEAAADAHSFSSYEETIASTCTAEGTEIAHCDYGCGTDDERKIEALGHNIVTDEYKAPLCTQTGLEEGSHCTRCDDMTVAQNEIAALGHTDEDGDSVCDACGETILCEHCERPVHKGCINKVICFVIRFIRLITSMLKEFIHLIV